MRPIAFLYTLCLAQSAFSTSRVLGEVPDRQDSSPTSHVHIIPVPGGLAAHPQDVAKRALQPRIDIPGLDIDDVAGEVWDKVKSEVSDAADAAKQTLEEAENAAEKTFNDVVVAAKKVVDDIKAEVEKVWDEIQKEVAELEDKVFTAVHDWVHEHIVEPLIKLLVIIIVILSILPLWWFLHLLAKLYLKNWFRRLRAKTFSKGRANGPREADDIEMTSWDNEPLNSSTAPTTRSNKVARLVVRSWQKYGQGALCLLCPFISGFISWMNSRKVPKLEHELELLQTEMQELRRQVNVLRAWKIDQARQNKEGGMPAMNLDRPNKW